MLGLVAISAFGDKSLASEKRGQLHGYVFMSFRAWRCVCAWNSYFSNKTIEFREKPYKWLWGFQTSSLSSILWSKDFKIIIVRLQDDSEEDHFVPDDFDLDFAEEDFILPVPLASAGPHTCGSSNKLVAEKCFKIV